MEKIMYLMKPCPFCGGKKMEVSGLNNNVVHFACAGCKMDFWHFMAVGETEQEAMKAAVVEWNRRAAV